MEVCYQPCHQACSPSPREYSLQTWDLVPVSWSNRQDVYELYFELGPDSYRRPQYIRQNACRT